MPMVKWMQAIDQKPYKFLKQIAKDKNISVQELIRARIIPDWLAVQNGGEKTC